MAKIEGLLRVAAMQSAEEVVLRENDPPALRVAGALRKLSMPAMPRELIAEMLREVIGDDVARDEGEGRYPFLDHAGMRVRWRSRDRMEASFSWGTAKSKPAVVAPVREPIASPVPATAYRSPESTSATLPEERGNVEEGSVLGRLLAIAMSAGASDLILAEGREVTGKVGGEVVVLGDALQSGEVVTLFGPLLDAARRATLDRTGSVDLAIQLGREPAPVRFRCSLFRALAGSAAVLRPIRSDVPSLRTLNLPPEIARLVEIRDGLVLFTGVAGSGKSTSLAALVELYAQKHARHVITLEDPIEYVFSRQRAVIHQREVGLHVSSFAEGLRAALRESPDLILLGEMRDPETIAAAVTAAETGHLVLSTLHAASAGSAFDRIIDVFPEHAQRQVRGQLADVLKVIVSQRLVPARDGTRVPALEILPVNAAVANLVREGKTFQIPQVLQTGRDAGMVPMARALAELVRNGVVDREVAKRHAPDPDALAQLLGGK